MNTSSTTGRNVAHHCRQLDDARFARQRGPFPRLAARGSVAPTIVAEAAPPSYGSGEPGDRRRQVPSAPTDRRAGVAHSGLPHDQAAGSGIPWSAAPMDSALDALAEVDLDVLDRRQLQDLLRELRRPLRRLEAIRTQITGALQRREAGADSGTRSPDGETRAFLTGELGLSPAEAKEVSGTAKQLPGAPATSDAYLDGRLTSRHTAVITSCLPNIPTEHRDTVEAELLELAGQLDPVALGRHARELIARHDVGTARTLERRRRARRRFSYHQTQDGGLRFAGELYGADAETARTAFAAFTAKPTADDQRSHDHRRADGLVTLAEAALRAGRAPSQHGVRPHVLVIIDQDELAAHQAGAGGIVQLGSGEHVTFDEARHLLGDCDLTRIVLDAKRAPIEVSEATRNVPAGLWRALQARDRGCTWSGCDAPAAWCDVAHLESPFALGGRLTPNTAALLCRRHHRTYDAGGWRACVDGAEVTYLRDPDRPAVTDLLREARRQGGPGPTNRRDAVQQARAGLAPVAPAAGEPAPASSRDGGSPRSGTSPPDSFMESTAIGASAEHSPTSNPPPQGTDPPSSSRGVRGHEILPVGGQRNSPVVDTRSPHLWT